jgi:peptide deformylase
MAIRTIRTEGDEILRKKSKKVEVIDEKIKELIQDMIETLHKYDGVGLAAVQVGILKQIVIIQEVADKPIYVIINPEIISQSGVQVVEEGCLSFPNKFAKIERPEKIKIRAMDENGKKVEIIGKGLLAQAISHEIDHLNGKVFIDKIIPGTLEIVKPEK